MELVLISGIKGFVGSNLKKALDKDYNVQGLSRSLNKSPKIICYRELTVTSLNSYKAFIHLAGKAHDIKKASDDSEYYHANTKLTKDLFDTFLKSSCKIFIYMSSVKAIADKVDGILYEADTPNPLSPYGKSKLKAEQYILSTKVPENKKVYILRPCMIHGPNNKGNLNLLYNIIDKRIPFPLGRFKNQRSFLSIDNLCYVIEKLLSVQPESDTFNLADDNSLSTNQLVSLIGHVINKPVKILNIPKKLIRFLALIGDILPLPLNTEKLNKLTQNYKVSNLKIKKVLGDLPVTTEEGIEKTVKSFQ